MNLIQHFINGICSVGESMGNLLDIFGTQSNFNRHDFLHENLEDGWKKDRAAIKGDWEKIIGKWDDNIR